MAVTLRWSNAALKDVDAIAEYIARDSPQHARRFVEESFALAESILDAPLIGRRVPEASRSDLRERFLYSYRLLYRVESEVITVFALIHARRQGEVIEARIS